MATPFPPMQTSNPLVHRAAMRFEEMYLRQDGFDGEERRLKREYWAQGRRTLVRLLARSVLSGDWNMGDSQTDVADALGLDRSCLSDAMWKGEMSMDTYNAIIFFGHRRIKWPAQNVINHMNRAGFIAVAKELASLVNDRKKVCAEDLTELHYELICESLEHARTSGLSAASKQYSDAGAMIVKKVCQSPDRHLIPVWYKREDIARATQEIGSLSENAERASRCLPELFANWFDIFAAATFVTEIGLRYVLEVTALPGA